MKIISNEYNANLPMNKWPTKGGPAKFANLFSNLLNKKGHQWVGVVDVYGGEVVKSELVTEKKNKWWRLIRIPDGYISEKFSKIKKYKNPTKSGASLINELVDIILVEKPDLVFINGNSCFAWTLLRAAKQLKIPTIVLHAGIWGLEIDIYNDYFSKAGIKIMKEMERDFATLASCNIFLNETSKNYFIKNIYKISKSKIKIVPLPCDTKNINYHKKKKVSTKINVGIVARWDRIKNHQAFLLTALELKKINPAYNFFAVTNIPATSCNTELKNEYRKNINVISPMDQNKLKLFYKKMTLLLLPSIFDVSPHVVLEAAFNGTPTFISKNVGYANSFKDNGLVNFIVDFSKPKKAAKQIDKFKNKVYPTNFVKKLRKIHDKQSVLKIFETIFNEIAYENSPTGIKSK